MSDKINLNDLANRHDHQLTITPREDPAERDARLRIEEANAAHQRRKELALHVATLVVVGLALGVCFFILLREGSVAGDKEWARQLLTAIVTGFVGYVVGKSTK
ncbi:MAG TPA: hypothetical protein VGB73_19560 [Pyrinomonadaceae bacterium]|jgi:hypothetical protein